MVSHSTSKQVHIVCCRTQLGSNRLYNLDYEFRFGRKVRKGGTRILQSHAALAYFATSAIAGSWALLDTPGASSALALDGSRQTAIVVGDKAAEQAPAACPSHSGAYGWMLYDMARGAAC
jgi:hypothetical protein